MTRKREQIMARARARRQRRDADRKGSCAPPTPDDVPTQIRHAAHAAVDAVSGLLDSAAATLKKVVAPPPPAPRPTPPPV